MSTISTLATKIDNSILEAIVAETPEKSQTATCAHCLHFAIVTTLEQICNKPVDMRVKWTSHVLWQYCAETSIVGEEVAQLLFQQYGRDWQTTFLSANDAERDSIYIESEKSNTYCRDMLCTYVDAACVESVGFYAFLLDKTIEAHNKHNYSFMFDEQQWIDEQKEKYMRLINYWH